MEMLIIVMTAFDKYPAQSSKNQPEQQQKPTTLPPLLFIECLLCTRHHVRWSNYIISVKPNNNPAK